jgi:hypothetical protein
MVIDQAQNPGALAVPALHGPAGQFSDLEQFSLGRPEAKTEGDACGDGRPCRQGDDRTPCAFCQPPEGTGANHR